MQALVSIHDVMPETLGQVQRLINCLPPGARPNTLLLVVPGRDWHAHQIDRLRRWQQQGFELAGHGWSHRARDNRSLYHRVHAALISRNAAEHLGQGRQDLLNLLSRCHQWFECWELMPPQIYVPPAWALGALRREDLNASPFRYFESTRGIYCSRTGAYRYLPLVGFEADTRWQAFALRFWNRMNLVLAGPQRPLRVALHPGDLRLMLAGDLLLQLNCLSGCLRFGDLPGQP
ncbi:DUF2334 domain-containing protein [Kineobactrum sediminis]|uniref:DUF2334 domain-containing protein n=1 Tax=Kineobactrum sediminis TaxID=1905677 RepID=A0A2N5Y5B1_9GAMM|nr:polysaccharide deacetylase family protein [Kineobactrum sediminis]PLW83577.1 DUF2334 domain-containing protein [Kineobactrum sediminis]